MKKMNTTKKIAVALAVMMVAVAMAAPAAMGVDVGYEATVTTTQNTELVSSDGAFGTIVAGNDKTIAESINLTNDGNTNASVSASALGFVGAADPTNNTITIDNLKINGVALNDTVIGDVPYDGATHSYNATLGIPNLQAADTYSTTVTLEFA